MTETGTDRDSQKERWNGVENREKKARPVSHFWFNYDHPPHPGRRIWVNVDETTWIEIYPSGHESRYKFKERIALNEITGVVLEKTSGDLAVTGTLNDGSFQVFIPDRNNPQLILAIRHRHEGQWSQWRGLALITPLE